MHRKSLAEFSLHTLSTVTPCLGAIALLVACSGGGSSGSSTTTTDPLAPAAPVELATAASALGIETGGVGGDDAGDAGVAGGAGDGAPIKGAVITLVDKNGVQLTGLTDSSGGFLIKFQASKITAPLVLRVVDAGGNVLSSVSADSAAVGKVIRANINPLTDKITSDVLSSTVVGTDKTFDGSKVDVSKLAQAKANLVTSVQAALAKAGVADTSKFDPVTSTYKYDGTGVDAVIESVSHSRDPATGATQLRAKLVAVSNAADGSVVPTLITASTPLAANLVATADNPGLTFAKMNSWLTAVNRCFGMTVAASDADAVCKEGGAGRLVSADYKHNSMPLTVHLKNLFSASAYGDYVQGSTLRNPTLLFTAKYPNSTASYDDLAVVEVTIRQPSVGSGAGADDVSTDPIEYTKVLVFRRDDTLSSATAGNWILHGNQRNYDLGVSTRYRILKQMNPSRSNNSSGGIPDQLQSRLQFSFNQYRYDATSQWVDAGVRAVRVTGPGIPSAGLVLLPTSVTGQTSFAFRGSNNTVPSSAVTTGNSQNSYGLAAVAMDGTDVYGTYFSSMESGTGWSTMLTDFSALQANARYKFEIFLKSSTSTDTADAIEYAYNVAPVFSPKAMLAMPLNDISPSVPLVQPSQAASRTLTVSWTNNNSAAPVYRAQVYAEERYPKGAITAVTSYTTLRINRTPGVSAAYSLGVRPTSQLVYSPDASTLFPSLTTAAGDYRQLAIWSWQGRADVQSMVRWDN